MKVSGQQEKAIGSREREEEEIWMRHWERQQLQQNRRHTCIVNISRIKLCTYLCK
jgi:hypothetical protein